MEREFSTSEDKQKGILVKADKLMVTMGDKIGDKVDKNQVIMRN